MTSVQVSNVSSCDSGWPKTFLIWFIVVPDSFYKLLPMLVLGLNNVGLASLWKGDIRPSKKKRVFLVRISIKKRAGRRFFFCYFLFPIACFLYILLPSARDTLELLGEILIKRNIRY